MNIFSQGWTYAALKVLVIGSIALGYLTGISGEVNAETLTGDESATALMESAPVAVGAPVTSVVTIESLTPTPTPIGDYVVGPGKIEITLRPGQTVTEYFTVANRISNDRSFELTVEDMSGSADGTQSVVLLGDQAGPYTLRDYVQFPQSQLKLNLNERARVPFTISMPPNAEPGGYYGAILVSTIDTLTQDGEMRTRSPINARVGVLLFITVAGDAEVSGRLTQFSTKNQQWLFSQGPVALLATMQNDGAVHLNPYGYVQIKNLLGEEVGTITIDPWFVLPQAVRTRELVWDREFLLGRYSLTLFLNKGYDNAIETSTVVIWVVPWQLLLVTLGVVVLLRLVISWFTKRFEFRRKT